MEWNYEIVLEFIQLLEEEPCIWNSKSKQHQNRNLVNDAWTRITRKLSVPCSIEELKKKRNTLLTQYRDYLKKIKKSKKTGSGDQEIYRPSWFAFDAIHKYMGAIYDSRPTIPARTKIKNENPLSLDAYPEELNLERSLSCESSVKRSVSRESNSGCESESVPVLKRQRNEQNEDSSFIKHKCNCTENEKEENECDLYGQLLAQKLKTLNVNNRLVLMNEIDNIVFKYIMKVRGMSEKETV